MDKKEHKLIQSYFREKYFISTAFRRASMPEDIWYYETIVWKWDKNTGKRGDMIDSQDSSSMPEIAMVAHCRILCSLEKEVA